MTVGGEEVSRIGRGLLVLLGVRAGDGEKEADKLVRSSKTSPRDVAIAVHRALTVARPRLRYMVGRRAKLAVALRRCLPGEWFERIYFGAVVRRVTQSSPPQNG